MDALQGAVIGVGNFGQHHARVLRELGYLAATCDIKQKADYQDYKKMLKETKLDFCIVSTPTETHYQIAKDIIKSGVHVLVEKPFVNYLSQAKELIELAEKQNVKLMVGFIERYGTYIQKLKQLQKEEIESIGITRINNLPAYSHMILDWSIHDIDLIRYITQSEIETAIPLTTNSSVLIAFKTTSSIPAYSLVKAGHGFKSRMIQVSTSTDLLTGDLATWNIEPLKLELEAFIKSIREDTQSPITGYDGYAALKVALDCIDKSKSDVASFTVNALAKPLTNS